MSILACLRIPLSLLFQSSNISLFDPREVLQGAVSQSGFISSTFATLISWSWKVQIDSWSCLQMGSGAAWGQFCDLVLNIFHPLHLPKTVTFVNPDQGVCVLSVGGTGPDCELSPSSKAVARHDPSERLFQQQPPYGEAPRPFWRSSRRKKIPFPKRRGRETLSESESDWKVKAKLKLSQPSSDAATKSCLQF